MQGPYAQNETNSERREVVFLLVDETDKSTPETGEGGGQPQIRLPGTTVWANTTATLTHVGNGHYTLVLTAAELATVGKYSVRYKSANTLEFQDSFSVEVQSSDLSLDEVLTKIQDNATTLKYIVHMLTSSGGSNQGLDFIDPL